MAADKITSEPKEPDNSEEEEPTLEDEKPVPEKNPAPVKKPAPSKKLAPSKKPAPAAAKKEKPVSLAAQALKYRDTLNKYFIEHRQKHGKWSDEFRGGGLFQTVVALDALWSQGKIANIQVGYNPDLLDEDVEYILSFLEGKPVEESFPQYKMEGMGSPSPEVAAVVIRALIGTRQRLKKNGTWDTERTRIKFEKICDRALEFIADCVDKDSRGWGFLQGGPSRLYPTCTVVRSLSFILDDPILFNEKSVNDVVPELIKGGKQYIEKCLKGERYTNRVEGDPKDLYSANALLALQAVHDHFPERIEFETEVGSVFSRYRTRELPPDKEQQPDALTEDLYVKPGDEQPDLAYRDNSGRWPWLHALAVWIQRRPQFYQDEWQIAANHLLRFQIDSNPTKTIYIWNRASLALNAFRRYAAKNYRVTDYGLRKSMYNLFTDEGMAQNAYEFVRKQVMDREIDR